MPEDLALLEDAVRAAGAIALTFYGGDYKRWSKDGGSPVTEADLAVNAYLHDTLMAARPDYGWLSEESADDPARLSANARLRDRPHRRHGRLPQEPATLHRLRRRGGGWPPRLRRHIQSRQR